MKKAILILVLSFGIVCISFSQTDYSSISIGKQVWMISNLNVDRFRNGDFIPQAKTNEEWEKAGENKQPAWCYYDNESSNGELYGKLYNWYAVADSRGLAPIGWHLPSDEEWSTLVNYLGGADVAGVKMKSTMGWKKNDKGTNGSGFSGLPGGIRANEGYFGAIGMGGYWWSSTETNKFDALSRFLGYINVDVSSDEYGKEKGLSVRCLKD
jgi:uncharacterized protein (TIGR02145 family)